MKSLRLLALSALTLIFACSLSLLSQMVHHEEMETEENLEAYHTQPIDGVLVLNDALAYHAE